MDKQKIDLSNLNKKKTKNRALRHFMQSSKKSNEIARDENGRFVSGSGGVSQLKKLNLGMVIIIMLIAGLSGGAWVFKSFAASTPNCPSGTINLGLHTGYRNGQSFKLRLCRIAGFRSLAQEDGGYVRVSSTVALRWKKLYDASKKHRINLVADASFRSHARQTELYNCWKRRVRGCNQAAAPGYSNHQAGEAVDIDILPGKGNDPSLVQCKTNPTKYPTYSFLRVYGAMKNINLYAAIQSECWHWSPTGK